MPGKNRKNELDRFDGFADLDEEFEQIEALVGDLVTKLTSKKDWPKDQPVIMGFALKFNEWGQPAVTEFSNLPDITIAKPAEPLISVDNRGETIFVTAELPGLQKKDVDVHASEHELEITAFNAQQCYYKKIGLPIAIIPNQTRCHYNNGILEIHLAKKATNKTKIQID